MLQEKREAFLSALSETGSVTDAAKAADVSRMTVYRLRKEDETFAAEWEDAYAKGADALEDEAHKRAINGSDTLLIFLLKGRKRSTYGERVAVGGDKDAPPIKTEDVGDRDLAKAVAAILARGLNVGND